MVTIRALPKAINELYLLGPTLFIRLCQGKAAALAWAEEVTEPACVISWLTVAIARSVISGTQFSDAEREGWFDALDNVIARMKAGGATFIDVNEDILEKYHLYRLHQPLDINVRGKPEPAGQEVRLLIATAKAMSYVYVDFESPYLHQMRSLGLKVQIL